MFAAYCIIYSATVTIMNYTIRFEGILAFYMASLCRGVWYRGIERQVPGTAERSAALGGDCGHRFSGAYGAIGIMTGKTLAELRMMQGGLLLYTAATVSAVKFFMGRIANALFRTKDSPAEQKIVL